MKYGIVDIGSNTVRLSLFKVSNNKKITELLNKKSTAGLASYVKNGYMTKKGIDKLIRILLKYKAISEEFGFYKFKIFATASLRNIKNSEEVLKETEEAINEKIDLVTGEKEALYGYLGVCQKYQINSGTIVDIGGGSTEITELNDKNILSCISIPVGSLSMYTLYTDKIMPNSSQLKEMKKYARKKFSDFNISKTDTLHALGGTARVVGNVCMELNSLPTSTDIAADFVFDLFKRVSDRDWGLIRMILQVSPDRVHTIIPGLVILTELLKITDADRLLISKKGVREGYLMNIIDNF